MNLSQFTQRFHHLRQVQSEKDFPLRAGKKPAAILMPIIKEQELSVLFTVRSRHLSSHAGQISFPGGRFDEEDKTLQETALRETEEEIGIVRENINIIGNLPSYRTVSRYEVTPFISLVEPDFQLTINHSEVEEVFTVPLSYLIDHKNHLIHKALRGGDEYPIFFIPWKDKMIWGATAAFIRTLSNHLNH